MRFIARSVQTINLCYLSQVALILEPTPKKSMNCGGKIYYGTFGNTNNEFQGQTDDLTYRLTGDVMGFGMNRTNEGQAGEGHLVKAIIAYRRASAVYEACDESDLTNDVGYETTVLMTYGPHLDILEKWSAPAADQREGIEALRFALSENLTFDGPRTVSGMLKAVIGFLEAAAH